MDDIEKYGRILIQVIEQLRTIDPEMQMQTAQVLLHTAVKPGILQKELQDLIGVERSAMSRNVAILSKHGYRKGVPGHELIVATEDIEDRKRKVLHLTPKGRRLMNSIVALME